MTILLCDIGGTHIRFGLSHDGVTVASIAKLKVAQFSSFDAALNDYIQTHHLQQKVTCFALSTAARLIDGVYRFTNENAWVIDPSKLKSNFGFDTVHIINDFDANARGIACCTNDDLLPLKSEAHVDDKDMRRMVIGVGTGLGLAYINPDNTIQPSFGGHMVASLLSDEDCALFTFIHKDNTSPRAMIFEDALSGKGLFKIYQFLCAINHLDCEYGDVSVLFNHSENPLVQQSCRIFARFLGIFAHQACVFGHSFHGIYLTGGIIDRLVQQNMFDTEFFLNGFLHDNVAVVRNAFDNTPIYWVRDEFISLKGLLGLCWTPI